MTGHRGRLDGGFLYHLRGRRDDDVSGEASAMCTACRRRRPVDALLLVHVAGAPRYCVCRPGELGTCFRTAVGPASAERIEPLAAFLARPAINEGENEQ